MRPNGQMPQLQPLGKMQIPAPEPTIEDRINQQQMNLQKINDAEAQERNNYGKFWSQQCMAIFLALLNGGAFSPDASIEEMEEMALQTVERMRKKLFDYELSLQPQTPNLERLIEVKGLVTTDLNSLVEQRNNLIAASQKQQDTATENSAPKDAV